MMIGRLRHQVTIKAPTITGRDSSGAPQVTYSDLATIWAEVADLSGREYFAAQKDNAEVTTRIRIRHRSQLRPDMRVVHGSRTFEIVSIIDPDGRGRELQLMCSEAVM